MHLDLLILKETEEQVKKILDSDYSKVDINEMVNGLDIHWDSKRELKKTLKKFPTLFGGGLGELKGKKAMIKLKKGAKPYVRSFYHLPKAYKGPAKKEIERMVRMGILCKLRWNDDTPWAAALFCQPKKTGNLHIIADFCKMNECIKQHPFLIPNILKTLQQLSRFKLATALDLLQGFYTIPLDKESQKICMTVTQFGKYAYTKLSMGIACAPDIFQSIMMVIWTIY